MPAWKIQLAKIARGYKNLSVLLLNTIITLFFFNLLALAIVRIAGAMAPENPVTAKYGEALRKAYPSMSEEQMNALLTETWSRPVLYEAYTQFKERPFRGEYVNVSAYGNRRVREQGPLPLHPRYYNIFVFGGSTTFGYGVADWETIPSYLQEELRNNLNQRVRVFNFGRGYYFSTQERYFFDQLLARGIKPHATIFIDGLNDFVLGDGVPAFTAGLSAFMNGSHIQQTQPWYSDLAVFQLLKLFQGPDPAMVSAVSTPVLPTEKRGGEASIYGQRPYLEKVIQRYLNNKRMIQSLGGLNGVRTIFVWQPVPAYKYDLSHHVFAESGLGPHSYSGFGYPLMKRRYDAHTLGNNFLWCADVQEHAKKLLYVDLVHYSPELNRMIAQCIAKQVIERRLLYVPR